MFRKRSRRVVLALLLLLLAGVGTLLHLEQRGTDAERSNTYALDADEVALLQDGDLILRRGYGLVSGMIVDLLKEDRRLSHCGIVVEHKGELWVVHAVSNNISETDGMQSHRLADFVRQSQPGSVVVCRLRTAGDRSGISRRALEHLQAKVPFDHHFDLEDDRSFYCSELIWRVIRDEFEVDIYDGLLDEEKSYYRFACFLRDDLFEVVLDHQK